MESRVLEAMVQRDVELNVAGVRGVSAHEARLARLTPPHARTHKQQLSSPRRGFPKTNPFLYSHRAVRCVEAAVR